ncbi:MAG TPA: exodeoxyribonuclease VII small subunit [Solirubrobacteraceae bacterium]|nr:exodeoxyribonuclease VII small subunit [Solirubrobacteraceae bacterium]
MSEIAMSEAAVSESVVSEAVDPPQASMFEADAALEVHAARGAPKRKHSAEPITFEQGYEELKAIVARLDDPDLPIHEMFEGFRRGKGLEQALRTYLQEREGELAELEAGNDLVEFQIVAPSN